ncbi:alpha/beta hydrolase domain-containing protein [Peribacillus sp. JNUCC 23]
MKIGKRNTNTVLSIILLLGLLCGNTFVSASSNSDDLVYSAQANRHNDTAKITKNMKALPKVKEIPYGEGMTFHSEPTSISHPFSSMYSSSGRVDIWNDYGYEEKEFFMSGKANVYDINKKDDPSIKSLGNDYTTRLLVRFPKDASKFSGRVYVDILNASSGVDLEDTFGRSYDWYMNEGHAYIGITSKTDTINALKKFDSNRYADLNWKVNGVDENGLVWDMISQLGTKLRDKSAGDILGGLDPKYVYLSGQSQSGFYLNTYITLFDDFLKKSNKRKPLFDGYLNLVGPGTTNVRSNGPKPSVTYSETSVPYIVIMSEFEHRFGSLTEYPEYERKKDSNSKKNKFRFYEVAGTPHTDPTLAVIPNSAEIALGNGKGRPPKEYDAGHYESDLNLQIFVNAAQENMHKWVTKGIPAPSAQGKWIDYKKTKTKGKTLYTPKTDEHGNALGGIRAPMMEYPIATYYASRNGLPFETNGSMVFFTADKLAKLYPDFEKDYKKPFIKQAKKLLDTGYILQEGYDKLVTYVNEKKGFGGPDAEKISAIANAKPTKIVEKTFDHEAIGFHPEKQPDVEANPNLSHPYNSMLSSVGSVDIWGDYDYTEKEFFLSGKANVYEVGKIEGNDVPTIKSGPHDYTNRIIVRMPKNMKNFSGAVYIDILNASNNSDMEDTWRRSWEYYMQNGHGYIGITSKNVNVSALKKFDPVRYAAIDWGADQAGEYENGLFWDMLSQLGVALHDDEQSAQILGKKPDFVFLGGQSQSGMYLNTYTNTFQPYLYDAKKKEYLFDGYYNWVGPRPTSLTPPLQPVPSTNENSPQTIFKAMGVPNIAIMSQAEFKAKEASPSTYKSKKDQNSEYDIFRLYEVASTPHSDAISPIIPNNDAIVKAGAKARLYPTSPLLNTIKSDLHIDMFVSGALQNLYDYAMAKKANLHADPKKYFPSADDRWVNIDPATGKFTRDVHGNVVGGIRHPLADHPLATYMVESDFMTMFTNEKLKNLYGTRENWMANMNASVDQLLAENLIPQTVAASYKKVIAENTSPWNQQ